METKILNNYEICFYSKKEWDTDIQIVHNFSTIDERCKLILKKICWAFKQGYTEHVYMGKVSDIPENTLDLIMDNSDFIDEKLCYCGERNTCYYCEGISKSAPIDLFKTLSKLPYCKIGLIYDKIKT